MDNRHRHLAQSVLLEESGSPLVIRAVIMFSAALLVLFILWSVVAQVDEVAVATGEIVPPSKLQQVQNPEGGRIAELLVKDGDPVSKGQVILKFDTFSIASELREAEAQKKSLHAQRERLEAFLRDKPVPPLVADETRGPQQTQSMLLRQLITTRETGKAIYRDKAQQIKASIEEVTGRRKYLEEKKSTLDEEYTMRMSLLEKGMTTKLNILTLRRQIADIESELEQITPKKKRLERELDEAANQLKKNESDIRERALLELSKADDDLVKMTEQVQRLEERRRLSEVRAPADGFAHGLKTYTVGGVIGRGEQILEVVPTDKSLIAEIRISPRDIGLVKVGQEVKLRMTAYDFSRFGIAKGTLADISPAALVEKNGTPYHKGIVALEQNYVGNTPGLHPVMPGMTLNADIKTGSKSVMAYLLKPIYTSAKLAFHER